MNTERILYFHCFSGVSGDMVIGSLLDTALTDLSYLESELNTLEMTGYELEAKKILRAGISGTGFKVVDKGSPQPMRTLSDLLKIVEDSGVSHGVKEKASEVLTNLARAESRVHQIPLDEVHFHEIGAVDTVVDILGTLILLDKLSIDRVVSSPLNTGTGFVECSHGKLPVPAPATMELLRGVPVYSSGVQHELVTPTGAALLTTLSSSFGEMPGGKIVSTGYGAGQRDLEHPNLLRAVILERGEGNIALPGEEMISLETNIDDMNPEVYSHLMDLLFSEGALDVTLTPIHMKKNRPGTGLTVLCHTAKMDTLVDIIFKETSTFGVRVFRGQRFCLEREVKRVNTPYGDVNVKVGFWKGVPVTFSPEYEDCSRLAREKDIPVKIIYRDARQSAEGLYRR